MTIKIPEKTTKSTDKITTYIIIMAATAMTGMFIIGISTISGYLFFDNTKVETINLFSTSFLSAAVAMLAWIEMGKKS